MGILEENNDYAWAVSDFLNDCPRAVTPAMMKEADPDGKIPKEVVWTALVSSLLSLSDFEVRTYLRPGVRMVSADEFLSDPYISGIDFPEKYSNGWRLTHLRYSPYEAFLRDDIKVGADMREIPQLGFFDRLVEYPAVLQNGREWMAVKPSEIASMRNAIAGVHGNVAVFGLGLGYFPFMASARPEVDSLTIVELDRNVIELFETCLLPQFPHSGKIKIVCSDAFEFMESGMKDSDGKPFDSAFVDIWHDAEDGPDKYVKARKILSSKGLDVWYWAEDSMESALRWKSAHPEG